MLLREENDSKQLDEIQAWGGAGGFGGWVLGLITTGYVPLAF